MQLKSLVFGSLIVGFCFAQSTNENKIFFDQNLVVFLDVINWENNQAMNNSQIKVMDTTGKVLQSDRHPRFKLSSGVAFTPNCIWIDMPAYNPYARSEPNAGQLAQSVSCIDRKSGTPTDFFVEGMTAQTPSVTQDGNAVIFGSGSKPVVVLARDNKTIKVLDLRSVNSDVQLTVKGPGTYVHANQKYYQLVDLGVGKSAILKLDEKTLGFEKLKSIPGGALTTLFATRNGLVSVQHTDRGQPIGVFTLDWNLEKVQKFTRNLGCLQGGGSVLGYKAGSLLAFNAQSKSLFGYDFRGCQKIAQTPENLSLGVLKKNVIFFFTGPGQKQIPFFDLQTKKWNQLSAGQSIDWVQ